MKKEETVFSEQLVAAIRARGWFVQPIESGMTSRGIPDLWVETPFGNNWWELKTPPYAYADTGELVEVGWGAGQQSWCLNRYEHSARQRPCCTLVRFRDGKILSVRMDRFFKDGVIRQGHGVFELFDDINNLLANVKYCSLVY